MNPINYARGLLVELESAVGKQKTAVLAELKSVEERVHAFEVAHWGAAEEAVKAEVIAAVAAVLPKSTTK